MAVILYLSNRLVQVIEARGKGKSVTVQNVWQGIAPENSIINGIITDEDEFLVWIKEFFEKNRLPKKDISLVVNSSQFNQKVLEFPKLKGEEIKKMIPREFSENRTDNTLFVYYMLESEKPSEKQSVLATAVEMEFLLSYVKFFRQAGIEISSIDSEVNSLVRLFTNSPEIQQKTCLIQVLDGQEVISMLFVKGRYYYSQKNGLFNEDPFGGQAEELLAIRARLFQFVTSQQIKEPIEAIYICGAGQNDLKKEIEGDKVFTGDKVIHTDSAIQKKKVEFFYPIGELLGNKKGSTFFKQLKKEQRERKKKQDAIAFFIPPFAVSVVCLLITAYMGNSYFTGVQSLRKIQSAMQEIDAQSASYGLASASVGFMQKKIDMVEEIWSHLMSYPTINTSVEETLLECAKDEVSIEIKSFQRDTGVLALDAKAADVRSISEFVASLQERDMFEAVEYSGFTYMQESNDYSIHVVCCMAEAAGRKGGKK